MSSNDPSPAIRLERRGRVARITLDRPERHNALRAIDVKAMKAALDEAAADSGLRALVVTGAGDETFCAGASLSEMADGRMSGAVFDTLTDRLASHPLPTVARINGGVYGGGVELGLCCDFRVGVQGGRLTVPAARLGICYPPGGLRRYVTRLGLGLASRILLAAEELDADEMLRTGYLTHLVDREELDRRVDRLTERLVGLAPLAVRNMKRILLATASGESDMDELADLVEACAASEDLREGLRAVREGRDPDFAGR